MKTIPLRNSDKFTTVDDEDFDKFSGYSWVLNQYGYVIANIKVRKLVYKSISLSREIMQCEKGFQVDHINHDKLDNRKSNLRIVTQQQNLMNRKVFKNNKTGFKGVSVYGEKYRASIRKNGKREYLGFFKNPIDAAKAYDKRAIELFGEYAVLNFK